MKRPVDALLLVSVGGPENPEEVYPFLERIMAGNRTGIPEKRLALVARRYLDRGGVSPANSELRKIMASLRNLLAREGPDMPVYLGNRFSRPFLADTVREMASKRIRNALAFVTSPYGSDFSCLHYRNAIEAARAEAGASAPEIRKIRLFFNHPRFIRAQVLRLEEAMLASKTGPGLTPLMFTAHSLPSEYPSSALYERQIREACSLVASRCGFADWELAFQSRSGDPSRPWLGPTPEAGIRRLAELGARKVLVHPIGFMFDNMEIVYDLDEEASNLADGLGLRMIRVKTAGDHPEIIGMIRSLILEQEDERVPRDCLGTMGPPDDDCSGCLCDRSRAGTGGAARRTGRNRREEEAGTK